MLFNQLAIVRVVSIAEVDQILQHHQVVIKEMLAYVNQVITVQKETLIHQFLVQLVHLTTKLMQIQPVIVKPVPVDFIVKQLD